ncbi:MAG: hypothetical protein ACQERC_06305 [Bacteroidota bacterium]
MRYAVFYIGLIVMVATGCKKNAPEPYFGYEYFPTQQGFYQEYDVLEVFHDAESNPIPDTNSFRLKTLIGEKFEDNEGRAARKYFRYKYDQETGELLDERVWTLLLENSRGEVIEENQRKIRMVFALRAETEWDVNAYLPEEEQIVHYEDVHTSRKIPFGQLDSTVTVEYEDFFSLVDYQRKYEVYAKGIGLVKRSFKDFRIENFDTTAIEYGTEVHYELIDYGFE